MNLSELQKSIIEILRDDGRLSIEEISSKLNVDIDEARYNLTLLSRFELIEKQKDEKYYYKGDRSYIIFAEIMKFYPVENVMSMPAIVEEGTSIYDTVVYLFLENIGSVFITRDGDLVGVVSRKDLLKASISNNNLDEIPVSTIMTKMPNVRYAYKDTSVFDCASMIVKYEIDGIPIVDNQNGKLVVVGRITKTNLASMFVSMGYNYSVEEIL